MTQKKESFKKGSVVLTVKKSVEITDKQGIKRKVEKQFDISANGFSSVQWYGVKIVSGEKYYTDKAASLGAEKA
jgi:hypothetical protein